MHLQRGEKRALADLGIGNACAIKFDFELPGADIAAFGLNKDRKIGDDRYVVLFSNPRSPDGAIAMSAMSDSAIFMVDLDLLPDAVDRIVFTATHDSRPVSEARPLVVSIDGGKAQFNVAEHLTSEKAVMMVELYRHSSGWRVGTIAAGFNGGLGSLIQHFGGEVDAPAAARVEAPAARPTAPPAPPPSPPAAPVSLKKISLEKTNSSVSLKKTGSSFGEIVLNLNWNQGTQKRGLFGGGAKGVDLDLGVLFELSDGGKGAVQALGNSFGRYDQMPWIELSGDDRTGAVSGGETIRVNGRFFDNIKRIAVFANIYDGAPNWAKTDGIVRINVPGQPEIEVRMDEGRDNCRLCGIAVIDNVGGELKIDRHMRYYRDQKQYADTVGILLRWAAGSKD